MTKLKVVFMTRLPTSLVRQCTRGRMETMTSQVDSTTIWLIFRLAGSDWLDLGDVLADELGDGNALWIGCWDNDYDANGYQTAVSGHAFAIIDYGYDSFGDLYFTLLNPWGGGKLEHS